LIATAEQPLATSIVAKIDGVPSSQPLDIAFHGRVNFDLRPNTDIEISLPFAATNWQPGNTGDGLHDDKAADRSDHDRRATP
jgi:hypothetical protein